ncbi:MAG: 50S ribosomal protein L25/general stress protein Ctc [Wenzhouxiangellaceae bacterium]
MSSKTYEVPAELREDVGKGASRRLRRQKKVPAVVYGESRDPVALTLEHDYILHALDQEAFHASILELKVADGRKQKVILRDLQRHPFKPTIMHVDFQRISEDHELRIEVPLHFVNEEISSAGKQSGVVVSYLVTEIEIAALPKDLPEYIEVDLAGLEPGERVMLSELKLPEGVSIPALEHGDDYDTALVNAIFIREGQGSGELAAEADAALAEGAEPELGEEEAAEEVAEGEEGEEGETSEGEEAKDDSGDDKKSD